MTYKMTLEYQTALTEMIGECGDVHGNKENRIERILLDYETTREDRK